MTPEGERPTGWVLVRSDGTVMHFSGRAATLYPTITAACDAESVYRERYRSRLTVEPVWTRAAWEAEIKRLANGRETL